MGRIEGDVSPQRIEPAGTGAKFGRLGVEGGRAGDSAATPIGSNDRVRSSPPSYTDEEANPFTAAICLLIITTPCFPGAFANF